MNESVKKQVYETKEAIEAFPDTHFIDGDTKKNIASFIYDHVPLQDELNVLDAGVGDGDNFLIPLIKILEDKNKIKRIYISVFDKSQELISKLKSNLVSNGFKNSVSNTFIKNSKLQNITVTIDCFDLDLEIKYFENNREKYDVIISTYLLHHVLNWRFGVVKLLYGLKQNGLFIVGRRTGSLNELLDGNLEYHTEDDCKTELDKIFYKFKKIKNKHFYWDPEISATNNDNLRNFVSPFFNEKKECQRLFPIKDHKCNLYGTLKNWFIKGVYTYLWSEGKIEKAEIENIFQNIPLDKKIPVEYTEDGQQIFILTEYSNIAESQLNYWMTRPIIEKINNLNQLDINAFTKCFADLLATNSILFPTTKFISIHPWDIIKDGWATPVQILVNGNSFDNTNDLIKFIKNYLLYLAYSLSIDYSFNNLIFKEAKNIRRIKIIIHNKEEVEVDKEKSEIICFKIPAKYQWKIKWNPQAEERICKDIEKNIQHTKSHVCSYFVTNEIVKEIQNINFDFNDKILYADIINALKKSDVLNRELLNPVDEKYEKDLDGIAHILVAIATYFLNDINDKDYKQEVFYEPSKVLYDHGAKKVVGFGGIIRFEDHRSITLTPESTLNRIYKNLVKQRDTILYQLVNVLFCKIGVISWAEKMKHDVYKHQLKTAIISILIDSYAHNISAHSLAALKWWIELRHKMLDKRFIIKDNAELNCLQPSSIIFNKDKNEHDCKKSSSIKIKNSSDTTLKYYEALGLKDSTYNQDYYSLFDFLQFAEKETIGTLLQFSEKVKQKDGPEFNPRFPAPIDYALYPFFRFLRDKGAFWSGVTRDIAFGGESKTWYKILWEDFANNPLYLGTIAKSEGISKININLKIKTKEGYWVQGKFVTIDMSIIDYEERLSQNPNLAIEYDKNDYHYFEKLTDEQLKELIKGFESQSENNKVVANNDENIKVFDINNIKDKTRKEIENKRLVEKLDFILNKILLSVSDYKEIDCESKNEKLYNEKCKSNEDQFVRTKDYSKYSFIRLGKCFSHFREILNDEENFRVFLPGGIVGEHALFTIFENTIRNIKHYKELDTIKNIQENGIDFWISIEEDKLWITKQNDEKGGSNSTKEGSNEGKETKKPELFKVGVWLGHETKLITKEETEKDFGNGKKEKQPAEYLLFTITKNNLEPILDEQTGAPRMGGNSQDKACAAMLFNNKFSSVENKEKPRAQEYFPWIEFKTLKASGKDEPGITLEWQENQKAISENSRNEYIKNINKDIKGFLKKYFYLWRGEDVLDKNALLADDWENPSRAKFLVNESKWVDEDIINARKNGVIRLLDSSSKPESIDKLNNLYIKWLNKWLKDLNKKEIVICDNKNPILYIKLNNQNNLINNSSESTTQKKLKLSHGVEQTWNCNVRSHGNFLNYFFSDLKDKNIKLFDKYYTEVYSKYEDVDKGKKDYLFLEFIETIFTKVVIFDNRIFNRFPSSYGAIEDSNSKYFMINNELSLLVKNEDKTEFDQWLNQKDNKDTDVNFLVMHLSFIEQLEDNEGKKYSEDNLDKFIQDKLSPLFNDQSIIRENFIFVITSGRGRDKWRDSIKNKESKFDKFTIFKPVESLLSAIEQGVSYNDHIDIKFNLIKVLFGN